MIRHIFMNGKFEDIKSLIDFNKDNMVVNIKNIEILDLKYMIEKLNKIKDKYDNEVPFLYKCIKCLIKPKSHELEDKSIITAYIPNTHRIIIAKDNLFTRTNNLMSGYKDIDNIFRYLQIVFDFKFLNKLYFSIVVYSKDYEYRDFTAIIISLKPLDTKTIYDYSTKAILNNFTRLVSAAQDYSIKNDDDIGDKIIKIRNRSIIKDMDCGKNMFGETEAPIPDLDYVNKIYRFLNNGKERILRLDNMNLMDLYGLMRYITVSDSLIDGVYLNYTSIDNSIVIKDDIKCIDITIEKSKEVR